LFDGRDENAGENAKGEDQIAQRHAKHQSASKWKNQTGQYNIIIIAQFDSTTTLRNELY
jgi:hypothetical protein